MSPKFHESLVALQRVQESLKEVQCLLDLEKPSKEDIRGPLADIWNVLLMLRGHVIQNIVHHPTMKVAHGDDALKRELGSE